MGRMRKYGRHQRRIRSARQRVQLQTPTVAASLGGPVGGRGRAVGLRNAADWSAPARSPAMLMVSRPRGPRHHTGRTCQRMGLRRRGASRPISEGFRDLAPIHPPGAAPSVAGPLSKSRLGRAFGISSRPPCPLCMAPARGGGGQRAVSDATRSLSLLTPTRHNVGTSPGRHTGGSGGWSRGEDSRGVGGKGFRATGRVGAGRDRPSRRPA